MKISYIELVGKKYPLVFSLAASEAISDAFGGFDKMQEGLSGADTGKLAKTVDTVLAILLDAGQKYCKIAGIECPEALPCRPADVIDISDPAAVKAIFSAITNSNDREVEVASKNAEATTGN